MSGVGAAKAAEIAARVEAFVRDVVVPYEKDPRCGDHGPTDELVVELRQKARAAGVLTPPTRAKASQPTAPCYGAFAASRLIFLASDHLWTSVGPS